MDDTTLSLEIGNLYFVNGSMSYGAFVFLIRADRMRFNYA